MAPRTKLDNHVFETHAELVARLLPCARAIALFDSKARLVGNRGERPPEDIESRVPSVLREGTGSRPDPGLLVELPDGRHAALLALGTDSTTPPAGVCVITLAPPRGEPLPPLDTIRTRLAPVLQLLAREIAPPSASEKRLATLAERADELTWLLDASSRGQERDGEESLAGLLGAAVEHLGCDLGALFVPEKRLRITRGSSRGTSPAAEAELQRLQAPVLQWITRHNRPMTVDTSAGQTRSGFRVLAVPIPRPSGSPAGTIIFLRASERRAFAQKERFIVKHLAQQIAARLETRFDAATGLLTRAAMQAQVREWTSGAYGCVLHLNIDRLHVINQTLGFEAGDELIRHVAQLLEPPRLPPDSLAARLSGDAFAIVLRYADTEAATRCAESLQQAATELAQTVLGGRAPVSLSCGIAEFDGAEAEFARALALAEVACKAAKDRGRARVEVYYDTDRSMIRRSADSGTLIRLRNVLAQNQLELYAQKIIPLRNRSERTGYELLLRALDEEHGNRAPGELLAAAQRYQMESTVDLWVVEHALAAAARHRAALHASDVHLSLNISAQALTDETFLERTKECIAESGIAPGLIMFEITETAAVSSFAKAQAFVGELRAMGCRFALDDFGTGVNSLKYLKGLPVDRVKIDGSFISDLLSNAHSVATVRAIVSLARELHIETVAEYAESEAILRRLRELGVDFAQGFGVETPRPLGEVLDALSAAQSASALRLSLEL